MKTSDNATYWETSVDKDYRGLWFFVSVGMTEDRQEPFATMEEAKTAELKTCIGLTKRIGPCSDPSVNDS